MESKPTIKGAHGKVYIQIVGSSTIDTTPSLYLFTENQRYIFNCGEGTQRLFNQNRIKLSRIGQIFLTRMCWEYVGGLPGMAMTMRDTGRSKLSLLGPSCLEDFVHSTRSFLYHENLQFECVGFSEGDGKTYEDDNLTVWPVVVLPGNSLQRKPSDGFQFLGSDDSCDEELVNPPKRSCSIACSSEAVSYICQLSSLPGKFLPQKAKELGVPKGEMFGLLQRGNSVTLDNGKVVNPEDVLEPFHPGAVFIIVECPTEEHLEGLTNHPAYIPYQDGGKKIYPSLVVHFTALSVFSNERYQAWMKKFGPQTHHVLFNEAVCSHQFVFSSQAAIQYKLHTIHNEIFPSLHQQIPTAHAKEKDLPCNFTLAENLLKFRLKPPKAQGFDRTDMPVALDSKVIMEETTKLLQNKLSENALLSMNSKLFPHTRNNLLEHTDIKSQSLESQTGRFEMDNAELKTLKLLASEKVESINEKCLSQVNKPEDSGIGKRTFNLQSSHVSSDDKDNRIKTEIISNTLKSEEYSQQAVHDFSRGNIEKNTMQADEFIFSSCSYDNKNNSSSAADLSSVEGAVKQTTTPKIMSRETNSATGLKSVESNLKQITSPKIMTAGIDDAEIVFLGTGASLPSKYRNVSSALIRISENKILLLDAGEGTYGQMFRHYGNHLDDVVRRISCVFISHIHADHHLGLLRIMLKRQSLVPDEPLVVIAPRRIKSWLQNYDHCFERLHCSFIDSADLLAEDKRLESVLESALGSCKVQTVFVEHCNQACGLVLTHASGWKLVFSGDTRPCNDLILAGQDATVLIHEATLDDELTEEALFKMHSTTSEAIDVGIKMKAKFILLNHFSQRYPKIPVFSDQFSEHVGVAFDHMKVKFSQLHELPKLLPALKLIFAEEVEELSKLK